jgi:Lrp/AsnC family transcriptional regulator, regulator for asnA, asnC and gidA
MAQSGAQIGSHRDDAHTINTSILRYIGKHPRASNGEIAKSLRLSLPLVAAQVQALHARGGLRIRPVFNVDKASRLFVFCKMAINSADLNRALLDLAEKSEFVTVASIIGGRYNAFVYFTFSSMNDLHNIISNVLMKNPDISEIETSIISGSLWFNPEYINYGRLSLKPDVENNTNTLRLETSKCDLDELDICIISELQCDDRKSLRAIARDYNVSPGTVRYRLQRLESEEIIGFISFIDPAEISLNCFAIVEMSIDPNASASIVQILSRKSWLGHLMEVVGASNLIAFVNTRDLQEAHLLISDQIRSVPGIRSVTVRTIMDTFKLDPRWGFLTTAN